MKRTIISGNQRVTYTLIQAVRRDVLFQALPEAGIRVYAPKYMSLREIDRMVRERAEELTRMQREVDQRLEAHRLAHRITDGSAILIEGRRHILRLRQGQRRTGRISEGEYILTLPDPEDGTTTFPASAARRVASPFATRRAAGAAARRRAT